MARGATVSADTARLRRHVAALEGERHPVTSPKALTAAEQYVAEQLAVSGVAVERQQFRFRGGSFANVVGSLQGVDGDRARVLVGAHFDSVVGSPGADDNASGVAALLEIARLLAARPLPATVELVGFNLEESQGLTFRVGSRHFVDAARRRGVRYAGALVLEMVGYTAPEVHQDRPWLLFWKRLPPTGTFLAAVADRRSRRLMAVFRSAARSCSSGLEVVTFVSPFGGRLVAETRLSDNASFWDAGYPALMLTDTAFLRNPHYHRASDQLATLDLGFAARVVDAVVACVRDLAAEPR